MSKADNKKSICIIGAGISGLVLAYGLLQKGFKVIIFEKQEHIGGQLSVINSLNTPIEIYYHHNFKTDKDFIDLCKELNIHKNIKWLKAPMGYYTNNKLYDFGTLKSLFQFTPLSFKDKLVFLISTIKLKLINNLKYTEKFTAKEWFIKNAGHNVWNKIWKPLFQLKFGDKYNDISLTWVWDKIKLRSSAKTGIKEELGYMEGSYFFLCETLKKNIIKCGGIIKTNEKVLDVLKNEDNFLINTNLNKYSFDIVVSTLSSQETLTFNCFSDDYKNYLSKYKYNAVICGLIISQKAVSDRYWVNIGDENLPFGGLIEHTNFYNKSNYNNNNIIYVSKYLSKEDPMFKDYSNKKLRDLFIEGINKINNTFNENDIKDFKIFKYKYAQPIVEKNYQAPLFKTDTDNLYWISTHHTYPHDRGINYAIRRARDLAEIIL